MWSIHTKVQKLNWETTKALNKVRLLSVLMYFAHWTKACSFWLHFLHNSLMFLKCKIIVNSYSEKFSLELPSIENFFLIFTDFKLNGDRNKWYLEGFPLKLLQQNQSKRLSIDVSRSDIAFKNVSHSYMGWCHLHYLKNLICNVLSRKGQLSLY